MSSLNPTKPTQLIKPEGSRKIVVLNGSRQIDQVIRGEWITLKVLPENGLPRGIFQLSDAGKPETGKDGKPKVYEGQIIHTDKKSVFQLCAGKIIEHDRTAFKALETIDKPLAIGRFYSVSYLNGRSNSGSEIDGKPPVKMDDTPKPSKVINRGHSI